MFQHRKPLFFPDIYAIIKFDFSFGKYTDNSLELSGNELY